MTGLFLGPYTCTLKYIYRNCSACTLNRDCFFNRHLRIHLFYNLIFCLIVQFQSWLNQRFFLLHQSCYLEEKKETCHPLSKFILARKSSIKNIFFHKLVVSQCPFRHGYLQINNHQITSLN